MTDAIEIVLRQAGTDGKQRHLAVPALVPSQQIKELAVTELKMDSDAASRVNLVHNGKILEDGQSLKTQGVKGGHTVWVVDQAQPPSRQKEATNSRSMEGLAEQLGAGGGGEGVFTRRDGGGEDPITQQIRELENAVKHLIRSNDELRDAGPDPDFDEAIRENLVAIVHKQKLIEDIKRILEESQPHAAAEDRIQTEQEEDGVGNSNAAIGAGIADAGLFL